MKKFLLFFLLFILLIFGAIYVLLFSDSGNLVAKNYLQKKLDSELPGLKINDFYLRPNRLKVALDYKDILSAKADGTLELASLSLNLPYTITSKNLEPFNIKEQIEIGGKIAGKYDNLNIDASGDILGSKLDIKAKLALKELKAIEANVDKLQLGKIAKIAKADIVDGVLSLHAKASDLDHINAQAEGFVEFNEAANQLAQIDLKSLGKMQLNAQANSENQTLLASAKLHSKQLQIELNNAEYKNETLSAQIAAKSPNIKWINDKLQTDINANLTLKKIQDNLNIQGQVAGKNLNIDGLNLQLNMANLSGDVAAKIRANAALLGLKSTQLADAQIQAKLSHADIKSLQASGIVLQGKLLANLADNRLSANLKHANLEQALKLADAPLFANGFFDVDLNLKNLKKLAGEAQIILDSKSNPDYFYKLTQYKIDTPLSASAKFWLQNLDNIKFKADISSGLIDNLHLQGQMKNQMVDAHYTADAQLQNFNRLLQKNMQGKVAVEGEIQANKALNITMISKDFLGASLDAKLAGTIFNAELKNADLPRFAKAFDFSDIYAAKADARVNYDLKTQHGSVDATLNEGHLQPKPAINLINAITQNQIEKIVFNSGKFSSQITPASASLDAQLLAKNAQISAAGGSYGLKNKALHLPLQINLNNTLIKGTLKTLQNGKLQFVPDIQNTAQNLLNLVKKISGEEGASKAAGDAGGAEGAAASADGAADEAKKPGINLNSKEGRQDAARQLLKGLFK